MFDLRDLTNDGTPELIISPDQSRDSKCRIYTVVDGVLTHIDDLGSCGVFGYLPEKGLLSYNYDGTEFALNEFYSVSNESLTSEAVFYNNENALSDGAVLTYELNGEQVSITEYDEALAAYLDQPSLSIGRKYSFSDSSVNEAIHLSESWGAVLTDEQKALCREKLLELASYYENDTAFELCDLDGDNTPELIFSEGSSDISQCRIFTIGEDSLNEADIYAGVRGRFFFDTDNKTIFTADITGTNAWKLGGDVPDNYTPSSGVMECGRKYIITEEEITAALR